MRKGLESEYESQSTCCWMWKNVKSNELASRKICYQMNKVGRYNKVGKGLEYESQSTGSAAARGKRGSSRH